MGFLSIPQGQDPPKSDSPIRPFLVLQLMDTYGIWGSMAQSQWLRRVFLGPWFEVLA